MYNGLKGQYDELEKDAEKLAQQLEEEQSQPKKETSLEQLSKLEELTRPEQPVAEEEKSSLLSDTTKTDLENSSESS